MNTFVAFFRGINVGGKNRLPMAELTARLEGLGVSHVRTYIQSGNVVFRSPADDATELAETIQAAIEGSHGFAPQVLLLSRQELEDAVAANPFPEGEGEPQTLHLFFLSAAPGAPDLERLSSIKTERESFRLVGSVFYLHAPDGIGRSKLAAGVERALGVPATARNWRTVNRVLSMAADPEG